MISQLDHWQRLRGDESQPDQVSLPSSRLRIGRGGSASVKKKEKALTSWTPLTIELVVPIPERWSYDEVVLGGENDCERVWIVW